MTSETLDEHIAMLRAAGLDGKDAEELGLWFAAGDHSDCGWTNCQTATDLGLNKHTMQTVQRLTIAAAALVIAAEYESLTPFERWLHKKYTRAERARFNSRDLEMMRHGYEGARNG